MSAAREALYELGADVLTRFDRIEDTLNTRFAGQPAVRIACPHTTAAGSQLQPLDGDHTALEHCADTGMYNHPQRQRRPE
ncbi:hypothetical protein [Enteractinococcus fodinae]|uniref:DNA-binding transcriptional LysR family regulator n=1 Tax=Enteractinococcus fodinae TaxID=684663 RepID=A0ABU2B438_9MICC|nr:hypothetical protein [Enteractinococcus fodinae]MDR7348016.1 DNA-binding transcriptional LysR family regulator [Enteractinococcus fodinae]